MPRSGTKHRRPAEDRLRKSRIGMIGSVGPQLDEHEGDGKQQAPDQQRQRHRAGPQPYSCAGPRGVEQQRREPRPRSCRRRGSRSGARDGPAGCCSARRGDDQRGQRPIGMLMPEDPAPAGTVGEPAAEQRAGDAGQAEDGAEMPWYLPRSRGGMTSPMIAKASAIRPPPPRPWTARDADQHGHRVRPPRRAASRSGRSRWRPGRSAAGRTGRRSCPTAGSTRSRSAGRR